jgi:hypothetical protein
MPKLKCEKCGHEENVPQHCGQPMQIEKVNDTEMLVCWMGSECGKQAIPTHCGVPMTVK